MCICEEQAVDACLQMIRYASGDPGASIKWKKRVSTPGIAFKAKLGTSTRQFTDHAHLPSLGFIPIKSCLLFIRDSSSKSCQHGESQHPHKMNSRHP